MGAQLSPLDQATAAPPSKSQCHLTDAEIGPIGPTLHVMAILRP
jgi:hypothetical protein